MKNRKMWYECKNCQRHSGHFVKTTGNFHCAYCGFDTKVEEPQEAVVTEINKPKSNKRLYCPNCKGRMRYRMRRGDFICELCGTNHFATEKEERFLYPIQKEWKERNLR